MGNPLLFYATESTSIDLMMRYGADVNASNQVSSFLHSYCYYYDILFIILSDYTSYAGAERLYPFAPYYISELL